MKNHLKALLRKGDVAIGASVTMGHPEVAEVIGHAGFDWAFYDMEHTPMSLETVQNMMQVMSFSQCTPVVRVPWNDAVYVKKALDIGAHGIIVPMVNTKEEAERASRSMKYPPNGIRGFGPRRASLADPDYVKTADQELILAIQIESQKGVDNIDEILSVGGIDVVFLGPYDLSLNLGVLAQWNSEKFTSSVSKIADSAFRHGAYMGTLASGGIAKFAKQGFRLFVIDDDIDILKSGIAAALGAAREAARS
jgi:2-keto-3-deoxy-L-rhamnonate aldolase RhmA